MHFNILITVLLSSLFIIGAGCVKNNSNSDKTVPPPGARSTEAVESPVVSIVDKKDFEGGWKVNKPENRGFSSIILDADGLYYRHLLDLPLDDGTWQFMDGRLILKSSAGERMNAQFTDIRFEGNTLKMNSGEIEVIWERIVDASLPKAEI